MIVLFCPYFNKGKRRQNCHLLLLFVVTETEDTRCWEIHIYLHLPSSSSSSSLLALDLPPHLLLCRLVYVIEPLAGWLAGWQAGTVSQGYNFLSSLLLLLLLLLLLFLSLSLSPSIPLVLTKVREGKEIKEKTCSYYTTTYYVPLQRT